MERTQKFALPSKYYNEYYPLNILHAFAYYVYSITFYTLKFLFKVLTFVGLPWSSGLVILVN